ncbi:MAG TPA: pyridoxine 5'-phosphate synthase, partial [Chromatiales bacterium]|nr:pyridoxine 5'-phosphate synthase [Chromatiales bacterium]
AVAAIEQVVELNIGHSIIARAVIDGLSAAVSQMKQLMVGARRP